MKIKKSLSVLLAALLIASLTACGTQQTKAVNKTASKTSSEVPNETSSKALSKAPKNLSNEWIVITSDSTNTLNYYDYDLNKNTKKLLYQNHENYFPTAMLSKDKSILYFVKNDSNDESQLFQVNLKTKETKQLTSSKDNIENVDDLSMDYKNNILYMRVVQNDQHNFNLASLNLKTNAFTILNKSENDKSDQFFKYIDSGKLFAAEYSDKQELEIRNYCNSTQNFDKYTPTYTFLLKDPDGGVSKVLFKMDDNVGDAAISDDGASVLVVTGKNNKVTRSVSDKFLYYNSGASKTLLNIPDSNINGVKQIEFSKDGKGFYVLGKPLNENMERKLKFNLYYSSIENPQLKPVIDFPDKTIISFFPV